MAQVSAQVGAHQAQSLEWAWVDVAVDIGSFPYGYLTLTAAQVISGGVLSADEVVRLPRNALVRSFPVSVQAGPARWIRGGDVAEARMTDVSRPASTGDPQARVSVTLDFGGLRTVAGVGLSSALVHSVIQVKQWTGMGFGDQAVVTKEYYGDRITPDTPVLDAFVGETVVNFPSEVRTERLQVDLVGTFADAGEAASSLRLLLPDLPADVEISIDGGAPVWTAPGPVRDGREGWEAGDGDSDNPILSQTVDLAEALTALLADPDADVSDEVDLRVTLSARQPGVLILGPPDPASLVSADQIRYLTRAEVDPTRREMVFDEEGLQSLPLVLPPWAQRLEGVRLTVSGEFEPERITPALGPAYPVLAGGEAAVARAEMVLDSDRAAAVSLGDLEEQDGLMAVRLPLRAESSDAEVRVLLLEAGDGAPGGPVDGQASEPVTVSATDHETWYTFAFPESLAVEPGSEPAVALAVSRGRVAWALSNEPEARPVWHGPLVGPWLSLPPAGGLVGLGGRVRAVTTGSPDVPPLAPVLAALAPVVPSADGPFTVSVTPAEKSVTVEVTPESPTAPGSASVTFVAQALGRLVVDDVVAEVGVDS